MSALCSMLRLYHSASNYAGIVYLTQETALLIASFLLDAISKAISCSPYVQRERDQMHFCRVEPTTSLLDLAKLWPSSVLNSNRGGVSTAENRKRLFPGRRNWKLGEAVKKSSTKITCFQPKRYLDSHGRDTTASPHCPFLRPGKIRFRFSSVYESIVRHPFCDINTQTTLASLFVHHLTSNKVLFQPISHFDFVFILYI